MNLMLGFEYLDVDSCRPSYGLFILNSQMGEMSAHRGHAVEVSRPHAAEVSRPHPVEVSRPHAAEVHRPHAVEVSRPHAAEVSRPHSVEVSSSRLTTYDLQLWKVITSPYELRFGCS